VGGILAERSPSCPRFRGPKRQTEIGFPLAEPTVKMGGNAPSVYCAYLQMWIGRAYTQIVSNKKTGASSVVDLKHRWLLECDAEGEVRTFPEATEQGISDALATSYAALYDNVDESCVWCIGELDRRIIEIRTFPNGPTPFYGVVSTLTAEQFNTTVQTEFGALGVQADEVLTREQAESVFRAFFHSKSVPPGFRVVTKSYVFGTGT
jgi:hypothetical protein